MNITNRLLILTSITLLSCAQFFAQAPPDSVIKKYLAGTREEKIKCLGAYVFTFWKNDSIYAKKTVELATYFKNHNDDLGYDYAIMSISTHAMQKGDYVTTLNTAFSSLSRFTERHDTDGISWANINLNAAYQNSRNYIEAVKYNKILIPINIARQNKFGLLSTYQNIGTLYAEAFLPDSGLLYSQKALAIAYELKNDTFMSGPLATIAENYIARKDNDLALPFLRKAYAYRNTFPKKDEAMMYSWLNNDFAQAYLGMKRYDSTIFYSQASLRYSVGANDLIQALRSYEYLSKSFGLIGKQDSSNKYFRLATAIKDSLFSLDKIKAIEASGFRDQMHQQELETEKLKNEEERKQSVQFAALGIGIVSLLILFLLLSRSIAVKPRFVKIFGIIGLLITFEFLNLWLHPYLEEITHHSPILMLFSLAGIAALLVPLHHWLEHWITTKLVEKNEKIRLAAAQRIIEEAKKKTDQKSS